MQFPMKCEYFFDTKTPFDVDLLLKYIPNPILIYFLKLIYNTKFAETVICEHALNAKEEMNKLEDGFNRMINN